MIQYVEHVLRRLGVLPPFDKNDVLNASIDDKQRDATLIIEKLRRSVGRRLATNALLRESIQIAKRRTNSFAEFEKLVTHEEDRRE